MDLILDSKISVYDILNKSSHPLASYGAKCENGKWTGGTKTKELYKFKIKEMVESGKIKVVMYGIDSHYY